MTEPPPPPPPTSSPDSPVTLTFDTPEKIARWRPLVHWLLAIPHFLVLSAVGGVVQILAVIAWFAAVFTGRIPDGIQKPIAMYMRYNARVTTYALFQREEYPPFAFDIPFADPGDDARVRVDVVPAIEGRNRLTIFFRLFMVIPQILVLVFVTIAVLFVVLIGWFAVIIIGRWPTWMNDFLIGYLRWTTRVSAYFCLLTDEYPPYRLS
jgi:hypothetical protein